jgi:Predicted sugar kinase
MQRHKITAVTLVAKAGLDVAEAKSIEVEQWLSEIRGIRVRRLLHSRENISDSLHRDTDLILVFGGDGTVVSVCRHSLGTGVPVAGVNYGRIGFLAELSPDNWQQPLEQALREGVVVRPRMSLQFHLHRDGEVALKGEVVNDVVVTRGEVARLANLELAVDSRPFVSLRSDGLILATPTGASGYACSAGGPLMRPKLNAYIVAAICPYLSSFSPLVLTADTVFSIQVALGEKNLFLTLDGQETYPLQEKDRLEVWGAPERILMASFGIKSYFDRLCLAGFVQESKNC